MLLAVYGDVDAVYAVTHAESATEFYSRAFQSIDREKFLGFGLLIPIDTVFLCGSSGIKQLTWAALYDAHSEIDDSK